MEKRYQVFVSSTYEDLREERQQVMQALLELDCIPSGMELFSAADEDQWTLIKRMIAACDYYLVIIAGRYGSLGPDGKSYTRMEYEYAHECKKPVIAFIHAEPGKIQADRTDPDHTPQLAEFRSLAQQKMTKPWTTAEGLGSVVTVSMVKLIKNQPAIGWVRADQVLSENSAREMLELKQKNEELRLEMDQLRLQPPAGTDNLACGRETTALTFGFSGTSLVESRLTYTCSWDRLLSLLGPLMLDHASEQTLKSHLASMFSNIQKDCGTEIYDCYIREEDFQKVKLQFHALGFIHKVPVAGSSMAHWALTSYGEALLVKTSAIPSEVLGTKPVG